MFFILKQPLFLIKSHMNLPQGVNIIDERGKINLVVFGQYLDELWCILQRWCWRCPYMIFDILFISNRLRTCTFTHIWYYIGDLDSFGHVLDEISNKIEYMFFILCIYAQYLYITNPKTAPSSITGFWK